MSTQNQNQKEIQLPSIIEVYLDSLTDEERDRVIMAEVFKVGGGYIEGHKGGKEIVKKVRKVYKMDGFGLRKRTFLYSVAKEVEVFYESTPTQGCLIDHAKAGKSKDQYSTVGSAFDTFYRTYGEVAIQEIKKYAAKKNMIEIEFTREPEVEKSVSIKEEEFINSERKLVLSD